ncbi:MAG TPA: GH25 family lysozyme [Frankiaceae bacterium]|nr:GH25 family lysozyme [Frankiaceae bacterium]
MRRRWVVAAGVVVALGAGAAIGRYVWLPSYRPSLRAGETYGLDVSHHQGPIDWARVKGDGIAFAYVKATEGGDHVDTRFSDNWSGAGSAGVERGAYHFFTLCTPGVRQAQHFLATVPDGPALPPALDLELAGNCAARPPAQDVRAEVTAFAEVVEQARGQRVLLYVGDDFAERYFRDLGGREQWVPRVLRRPGGEWRVWQASAWARVDGVAGPVDLDVRRSP